jgi:hypothetical protein
VVRIVSRGAPDRNFWLGVSNGAFVSAGEAFFHSGLVLAPFLAALGAPGWAIGLIPALRVGGWFLPQLVVASWLAHVPLKLPVYWWTSTIRILALVAMVVVVFVSDRADVIVVASLVLIFVNSVVGGVGGIPFTDVTAKVVPHYRLGTFWVLRNTVGGVMALGSGLVLRRVLASDIPFPDNFGVIFACSALLMGLAYLSFSLVREPPGVPASKESLLAMLRRLPSVLRRDVSFRRYLHVRFIALAAFMAEPFYAVYAIERLGAPLAAVGTFVIVATVASIVANFLMRVPADRAQNVRVLQVSVACMVIAPVIAVLAPSWPFFMLVFAFSAAASSGMGIAVANLLYAVAPPAERPLYIGVANSVLAIPSLAPIAAGAVAVATGYPIIFVAAAVLAAVSLTLSFRLKRLRVLDRTALEHSSGA